MLSSIMVQNAHRSIFQRLAHCIPYHAAPTLMHDPNAERPSMHSLSVAKNANRMLFSYLHLSVVVVFVFHLLHRFFDVVGCLVLDQFRCSGTYMEQFKQEVAK